MGIFLIGGDPIKNLLSYHKLKLIQARQRKIIEDTFDDGMGEWYGGFHHVTVDTNIDDKTGIEGDFLIDAAGSYNGGVVMRDFELENYGEIVFERYVRNDDVETGGNQLNFYIDDVLKMSIDGPSPWRRVEPIGVAPGKHTVKFEYIVEDRPNLKSGIFDTFTVWEGRSINTTITNYTPPKPYKNVASNDTLRGHTRFQEMVLSDTEINFSAIFKGESFIDFMANSGEVFYFVDEFGVCYRGLFPNSINPECKAMNKLYYINLSMIAPQKVGVGFV